MVRLDILGLNLKKTMYEANVSVLLNTLWQITAVVVFLSLRLLLHKNMGSSGLNEVDVLPLARQYFDPSWMPGDWYLNQAAGYRLLFQTLIGWLIVNCGFLAASIIGRLICYVLVAVGLVFISKQLRLSLPFLLLAIVLFTYFNGSSQQGVIASEWMVGGLEAKAFAYGFVLMAIAFLLAKRYLFTALLLGVATSFQVLVGGWAFLTVAGWFCLHYLKRLGQISQAIPQLLLAYIIASIFAIPAIWQQLFVARPINTNLPAPSYIYVYLRLSHHLNPFTWSSKRWIEPILYLLVLVVSTILLKKLASQRKCPEQDDYARQELGELALVSLIPFILGLVAAFFDSQGQLLQYYPFRFGDVMLPLITCLLLACVLEHFFWVHQHQLKFAICTVLISLALNLQAIPFYQDLLALQQFPAQEQNVSPEWKEMSNWIRLNTAKNAVIISNPVELDNFSWLTERSTIAKFKLFAQTKARILEQYQRWDDLSGNSVLSAYLKSGSVSKQKTRKVLANGYAHLTVAQVETLMTKYKANYFLTNVAHHLDLEIAHRQSPYILYVKSK